MRLTARSLCVVDPSAVIPPKAAAYVFSHSQRRGGGDVSTDIRCFYRGSFARRSNIVRVVSDLFASRRTPTDHFPSPEALRSWISNNAGIPPQRQILMTSKGKNVKQQHLLTEV